MVDFFSYCLLTFQIQLTVLRELFLLWSLKEMRRVLPNVGAPSEVIEKTLLICTIVIRSVNNDPDPGDMTGLALVRYQDPLNGNKTGLHLSVEHKQYQML
jgi:hypothetical protein